MKNRKIVQISSSFSYNFLLVALCDDGTLWGCTKPLYQVEADWYEDKANWYQINIDSITTKERKGDE